MKYILLISASALVLSAAVQASPLYSHTTHTPDTEPVSSYKIAASYFLPNYEGNTYKFESDNPPCTSFRSDCQAATACASNAHLYLVDDGCGGKCNVCLTCSDVSCESTTEKCVNGECKTKDCTENTSLCQGETPICDQTKKICRKKQCSDLDCGDKICDENTLTCREKNCPEEKTCDKGLACDATSGQCVNDTCPGLKVSNCDTTNNITTDCETIASNKKCCTCTAKNCVNTEDFCSTNQKCDTNQKKCVDKTCADTGGPLCPSGQDCINGECQSAINCAPLAIGDLLYSDKTVCDLVITGREQEVVGIVFDVDNKLAVSLGYYYIGSGSWGSNADIPSLSKIPNLNNALKDENGEENTKKIKTYFQENNIKSDFITALDTQEQWTYLKGWYIPSLKELNKLQLNRQVIDNVIGTKLSFNPEAVKLLIDFYGSYYWSSTQGNSGYAWILDINPQSWLAQINGKGTSNLIRPIVSFKTCEEKGKKECNGTCIDVDKCCGDECTPLDKCKEKIEKTGNSAFAETVDDVFNNCQYYNNCYIYGDIYGDELYLDSGATFRSVNQICPDIGSEYASINVQTLVPYENVFDVNVYTGELKGNYWQDSVFNKKSSVGSITAGGDDNTSLNLTFNAPVSMDNITIGPYAGDSSISIKDSSVYLNYITIDDDFNGTLTLNSDTSWIITEDINAMGQNTQLSLITSNSTGQDFFNHGFRFTNLFIRNTNMDIGKNTIIQAPLEKNTSTSFDEMSHWNITLNGGYFGGEYGYIYSTGTCKVSILSNCQYSSLYNGLLIYGEYKCNGSSNQLVNNCYRLNSYTDDN